MTSNLFSELSLRHLKLHHRIVGSRRFKIFNRLANFSTYGLRAKHRTRNFLWTFSEINRTGESFAWHFRSRHERLVYTSRVPSGSAKMDRQVHRDKCFHPSMLSFCRKRNVTRYFLFYYTKIIRKVHITFLRFTFYDIYVAFVLHDIHIIWEWKLGRNIYLF